MFAYEKVYFEKYMNSQCCNIDKDMFPRQDPILECSQVWQRQVTVNQYCMTININKHSHRLANWDKALWQLFSTSHIKLTLNLWIAFLYYLEKFREVILPFIELYKYWLFLSILSSSPDLVQTTRNATRIKFFIVHIYIFICSASKASFPHRIFILVVHNLSANTFDAKIILSILIIRESRAMFEFFT